MKRFLITALAPLLFLGALTVLSPTPAAAYPLTTFAAENSAGEACKAIQEISPGETCDAGSSSTLNRLVRLTVNTLSLVAGVIAVIMLIVSGFKFITSEGDAARTKSARQSLIYAIVGLVVVVVAQVIVRFVLHKGSRL